MRLGETSKPLAYIFIRYDVQFRQKKVSDSYATLGHISEQIRASVGIFHKIPKL